jgi:hypothetical protein
MNRKNNQKKIGNKKKGSNMLIFVLITALILVGISVIKTQYLQKSASESKQIKNPNFTQKEVEIKQIKTHIPHDAPDVLVDDLIYASGHYIYKGNWKYEKIIYDGKIVHEGPYIDVLLSDNGEHYLLTVANNDGTFNLHIDDQLILKGEKEPYHMIALADNGKDYFYTREMRTSEGVIEYEGLYKSGKLIRTNTTPYESEEGEETLDLKDDGREIKSPDEYPITRLRFSDNGEHVLIVTLDTNTCTVGLGTNCNIIYIYADGKKVASEKSFIYKPFFINNEGRFAFVTTEGIYLHSTLFSFPPEDIIPTWDDIQINKAQTHYLATYKSYINDYHPKFYLDGKEIKLPILSDDDYAELRDNTIYVYNVVKDSK